MNNIAIRATTLACCLAMAPALLQGQNAPPLITVSGVLLPYSTVDNPRPGTFEEGVEVLITNPRLSLNIPASLGPGTALVTSVNFKMLAYTYRGLVVVPGIFTPDELYDVSLRLALRTTLSDSWSLTLVAEPGIASDLENISSNHLKIQGGAIFGYSISRQTQLGFGALVQNQFGQVLPLPVLTIRSRDERTIVDAQLPRRGRFMYIANEHWQLGVAAEVEGNSYRMGDSGTRTEDPIVKYSTITAGPAIRGQIAPTVVLNLSGGLSVFRRFEITDNNNVELRTIDLTPGAFARIGLELTPRSWLN